MAGPSLAVVFGETRRLKRADLNERYGDVTSTTKQAQKLAALFRPIGRMGNPLYPVDYDDIRVVCPVRNCAAVDAHGYIFIVLFDQARPRHERIAAQVTWRASHSGNAEQRRAEAEAALSAPHFCV